MAAALAVERLLENWRRIDARWRRWTLEQLPLRQVSSLKESLGVT
jgi:hypothetical protein